MDDNDYKYKSSVFSKSAMVKLILLLILPQMQKGRKCMMKKYDNNENGFCR